MHPEYTPADIERFWSKVDRSGGADACWLWTKGLHPFGYGNFWAQRKNVGAHRFVYVITFGSIPDDMLVCHRCDNPPCCNPAHMFLGTQADNVADRRVKGRSATGLRNSSRKAPERLPRGDRHWSHREPERVSRGERNGKARITEDDVQTIRARYALGERLQALADDYSVTKQAIWLIVKRKNWSHVE